MDYENFLKTSNGPLIFHVSCFIFEVFFTPLLDHNINDTRGMTSPFLFTYYFDLSFDIHIVIIH